jgi:hypothetical protein
MRDSIWNRILSPEHGDLPSDAARYFLSLGFTPADKLRYQELVAKEHFDLSFEEQSELNQLVHANTVLMLLQAKARRSLAERQPAA